jgi:hypothetical protein
VVRLDRPTGALEIDERVVERLRDAAAEMAGRSSATRDFSLVLERALTAGRVVALRRAEVQTLVEVCRPASRHPKVAEALAEERREKRVASPVSDSAERGE